MLEILKNNPKLLQIAGEVPKNKILMNIVTEKCEGIPRSKSGNFLKAVSPYSTTLSGTRAVSVTRGEDSVDRPDGTNCSETEIKILAMFGDDKRGDYILKPLTEEKAELNRWFTVNPESKLKNKIYGKKYLDRDFLPWRPDDRTFLDLYSDSRCVIGTRPGKHTNRLVIDIDNKPGSPSPYHPIVNPDGIPAIVSALAAIGLEGYIVTRSSESGGIHILFPLPEPAESIYLAKAVKTALEAAGIELGSGKLETFPNVKSDRSGLYNAVRLPLQPGTGAAILDDDFLPLTDSIDELYRFWQDSIARQDTEVLTAAIDAERGGANWKSSGRSGSSEAWQAIIQDRDALLKRGWTADSQTNKILGDLARYGVMIEGLQGEELADYIRGTAERMPGYARFCDHKHEIGKRAIDWARCAEKKYKPHRECKSERADFTPLPAPGMANDEKRADALDRLLKAVRSIEESGAIVSTVTEFYQMVRAIAGCSFSTIRKYWVSLLKAVFDRLYRPSAKVSKSIDSQSIENPEIVCNIAPCKDFSDFSDGAAGGENVCNPLSDKDCSDFDSGAYTKCGCEQREPKPPLSQFEDGSENQNLPEIKASSPPRARFNDFSEERERESSDALARILDRARTALGLKREEIPKPAEPSIESKPKPILKPIARSIVANGEPPPPPPSIVYAPQKGNTLENCPWPAWIPKIYRNRIGRSLWHLTGTPKPTRGAMTYWFLANPYDLDRFRPADG